MYLYSDDARCRKMERLFPFAFRVREARTTELHRTHSRLKIDIYHSVMSARKVQNACIEESRNQISP